MKDHFKDWYQVYLVLIGGIIIFLEGRYNFWCLISTENTVLLETIEKFGGAIIASGLTSFMLKANALKKAYRTALTEVIYTSEVLGERKDLKDIWERVSVVLFKKKFEEIHKPFLKIVGDVYFPGENITYTSGIKHHLSVDWEDEQHTMIKIIESSTFNVHTGSESKVEHTTKYNIKKIPGMNQSSVFEIKLHNASSEKQPQFDYSSNCKEVNGEYLIECETKLEGSLVYNVKQEIIRRQKLSEDDNFIYTAKYLINGIDVSVTHPKDLIVEFFEAGTPAKFERISEEPGFKRYAYRDVILKAQGYILTFKKKVE